MKYLFLSFLTFILAFGLRAQITEGVIIYENEIIQDFSDLEKALIEGSGSSENDSVDEKSIKHIASFLERKSRSDTAVFHFDKQLAKIIRQNYHGKERVNIYDINRLVEKSYRIKDGELKIDSAIWDFRVNPNWMVDYSVTELKNDRKFIIGYDCYKVEIFEDRMANGNLYQMKYELYVTDEIIFPPHLVCGWYDNIMSLCALEIKAWDLRIPDVYTVSTAVKFSEGVDEKVFDLPESLRID